MARQKIDVLKCYNEGFFGGVISEYPHSVYVERADTVHCNYPFKHETDVYFTYYHFDGLDYLTHMFNTKKEAEEEAERLSRLIEQDIMLGKTIHEGSEVKVFQETELTYHRGIYGTRVKAFNTLGGKYYMEFVNFSNNSREKYVVYYIKKEDDNISCRSNIYCEKYTRETMDIRCCKEFDSDKYDDAKEYLCYCGYEYCQKLRHQDSILRGYGIIIKKFADSIYLTYTPDLFVVYELDDNNKITRTYCSIDYINAEREAQSWLDKTLEKPSEE